MRFIKFLVKRDNLPLNFNQETLCDSKIMKVISNKLVRKTIYIIWNMAKKYDGMTPKKY